MKLRAGKEETGVTGKQQSFNELVHLHKYSYLSFMLLPLICINLSANISPLHLYIVCFLTQKMMITSPFLALRDKAY